MKPRLKKQSRLLQGWVAVQPPRLTVNSGPCQEGACPTASAGGGNAVTLCCRGAACSAAEEPDTPPGEGRGRIPAWTVLGGPATALASAPRSHSCPQARAQASPQSVLSKQRKGRLLSWLVVTNRTCFESPRGSHG